MAAVLGFAFLSSDELMKHNAIWCVSVDCVLRFSERGKLDFAGTRAEGGGDAKLVYMHLNFMFHFHLPKLWNLVTCSNKIGLKLM